MMLRTLAVITAVACVELILLPVRMVAAEVPAVLRLVGTADGVDFDQLVVENHEVYLRAADGTMQPIPQSTRWRVEGDLLANGDRVDWLTGYEIVRRPSLEATSTSRTRSHALVWVYRNTDWPTRAEKNAIAVIVWLVNGRQAWVEAIPIPRAVLHSSLFAAAYARELQPGEVDGVPLTLWWKDGEFVPPKPAYGHRHVHEALAVMNLGTAAEFTRVLPRKKTEREWLLHRAAAGSRPEIVEVLLQAGAGVHSETSGNSTALHRAARNGRLENARLLMAAGASPKAETTSGHSVVEFALGHGHLELALPWLKPRDERLRLPALELAVAYGDVARTRELLDLSGKVKWSRFPAKVLNRAKELGDAALLETLRDAGAPMDGTAPDAAAEASPEEATVTATFPNPFRQRVRIMDQVTWRADRSRGIGLLVVPDESYQDVWTRVKRNSGGGGTRVMWAAAALIVEEDGRPSEVQLLDAVSEPFWEAVLVMLRGSTFNPAEQDGRPVRTRMSLMVLADP